ncbi:hypothetical protein LTR85_000240 [Meristemomyces frigidus]|nr:hypothetical protein LTR85_000240 [Meristemomyces frigidus]
MQRPSFEPTSFHFTRTMVTVALAEASTGFGLIMLRTFLHLNTAGKYTVILLSRSAQPDLAAKGVDLVHALSDVHTLLATLGGDPPGLRDAQLALIAAVQEAGVKRFAPSEYASISNEGIDLYRHKSEVWAATQKCGMEYTRFSCGLFMSLLATGTPKPVTAVGEREGAKSGEEEALAGLRPWNFVINIKAGTADLLGDGSTEINLGVRGDVKSFRDIVRMVERVQKRKFLVGENSVASMKEKTADPGKTFYNQVRVAIAEGWGKKVPRNLNEAFPDVRTVTCEESVEMWWSGVELPESSWGEDQSFM